LKKVKRIVIEKFNFHLKVENEKIV